MKKTTWEWVGKAEVDFRGAMTLTVGREKANDLICFVCQQTVEKYQKAILEELGIEIPKTHNLIRLDELLQPHFKLQKFVRRGLPILNRYGVAVRYPGFSSTKRQATSDLRWAEKVRTACRTRLNLP